ncbi:MAG: beta-mannosidase [Clostridiales bacterium]|nr:beta-mannosidase [Clostridiales bacterium]
MISKKLNGKWKVSHVPYNSCISDILCENFVPEGWLDANIPEDIHGTLRRAGIIRGHYYGKDTDEEKWIEEVDWVYYKEFYIGSEYKKDKVVVEFEGLDTFCDIYLNGMQIGSGKNMHLGLTIDVKDKLKYGTRNVMIVRFYSPVKFVEGMDTTGLFSTTTIDRILARKAQMNYSWDFCGRCVTTGIWKDVTIKSYDHNYIDSYYLYTKEIGNTSAKLGLEVDLCSCIENNDRYTLTAELSKDGKIAASFTGTADEFKALELTVENPELWWPRPYGEAALYDFTLTLKKNEEIVDTKKQKVGIRTVEIIQEDQEDGKSFIFCVNGKRLFVRGANWVPINVVYTDITDEEYETYINYAVEGNLSMLRIWGGGIYENPKFFELCDEKGIMVFYDFMFACGIYPENEEFLKNVYEEAVYNIKKYRNYTCIVLWSGDNECDEAFQWDMRPYGFLDYKVNKVVLKSAWEKYDPHRFFIPSSPCSPFEFYKGGDNPKSPHQGDMHIYITSPYPDDTRYYKKIKTFRPRFMSEFGFISLPEKDTYYKFNFLKKSLLEQSPRISKFFPTWEKYLSDNNHDEIIYRSQEYNSYGLKYWIEYMRRLKWTCAGTLYWKFNDPVADTVKDGLFTTLMATVDMYKMPKMTFYYTKRAYEDVILVCDDTREGYDIYSVSELEKDLNGKLTISHMDFDGNIMWKKEMNCTVDRDSSKLLYKLNFKELNIKDKFREYIKVTFESQERTFYNRYFFVDIYEFDKLNFKDASLKVIKAWRQDDSIFVTLRTQRYARNVRLNILDQKASYEDNYFDMDANTERTVAVRLYDTQGIEDKVLYIEGKNVERLQVTLSEL